MWTILHYQYRDAGNFKAFGEIAFRGAINGAQRALVRSRLEAEQFFIAEQVGVPPLQSELQDEFGMSADDHCWHMFGAWEVVGQKPTTVADGGSLGRFVAQFASLKKWDETCSRNVA